MGKVYEQIDEKLATWIHKQHMFFVATAPHSEEGLINCSPKGLDTFRILDAHTVAYLDLTGSGIETIAHLRENGRIVIMFCAFEGAPNIVRLHGKGEVLEPTHPDFATVQPLFPEIPGTRSIIRVHVARVSDSCGFAVPRYKFDADRDTLIQYAESKGPDGMDVYRAKHNRHSLDNLPGLAIEEGAAMTNLIVVHADFEAHWPFVTEDIAALWQPSGATALIRLPRGNTQVLGAVVPADNEITRLITLGIPVTLGCLSHLPKLAEAAFLTAYGQALEPAMLDQVRAQGIVCYGHRSEGFWGQSVAEFALALTLCALRQIPQNYHAMLTSHEPWARYGADRNQGPGTLGAQYSDDRRFTSGTLAGKQVRIVGAGNIGSRYASFAHMLGADVAIWDPYAPDPGFHRAGARREDYLERLVADAEIFAPMLPLKADTRGVVTAAHINALPQGCLVVQATRALICDMPALRRRVLADELALAADVFDAEPVALDDPLLGRHNVVHTPHLAGRTRDANRQWATELLAQFKPMTVG